MKTISEERIDAWTNDCPIENAMLVFTCIGCMRLVSWEDGCADDMPDHCSICWCAEHELDGETSGVIRMVEAP
jgi:hypothetical protein